MPPAALEGAFLCRAHATIEGVLSGVWIPKGVGTHGVADRPRAARATFSLPSAADVCRQIAVWTGKRGDRATLLSLSSLVGWGGGGSLAGWGWYLAWGGWYLAWWGWYLA